MRQLSLNQRLALDAESTEEIEIMLLIVNHTALDKPIRLSTDPTMLIEDDPEVYGTRSTWRTANPVASPFYFALISTNQPSDMDGEPPSANIVIEADPELAENLRSVLTRATVDVAIVLAGTPNILEAEWLGMKVMEVSGDAASINVTFSREPLSAEPYPGDRMTRDRFPGLHQ